MSTNLINLSLSQKQSETDEYLGPHALTMMIRIQFLRKFQEFQNYENFNNCKNATEKIVRCLLSDLNDSLSVLNFENNI